MIPTDPYLLVRAASLYVTVVLTVGLWAWRPPSVRRVAGAVLACFWNLPVLLLIHVAAARFGWWEFDARGGLLLGMPVELYLAWAWLWGAAPALAFPALPLAAVVIVALGVDLVLMPAASPVLRLGPAWLVGEGIGLLVGLVPGQLLARWTARDERLTERAVLHALAFGGLLLFVLPAIVIEGSGGHWLNPLARPLWQISLIAQAIAIPALVGLSAVQEFATRGGGTPVPFDPPRRLVTTGVYAYIRNPMQLSAVVLLCLLGCALRNYWVSAAAVMAHFYSAGLAGWDEEEDLRQRFGEAWLSYRRHVRSWVPRFRPWYRLDHQPAHLFVAEGCGMCREVGGWFADRGPRQLAIVPADSHPARALTRITYEPGDGSPAATGVEAVARAFEHIHLGWALLGWLLRLPVICPFAQLLVDACGGEARMASRPSLNTPR